MLNFMHSFYFYVFSHEIRDISSWNCQKFFFFESIRSPKLRIKVASGSPFM